MKLRRGFASLRKMKPFATVVVGGLMSSLSLPTFAAPLAELPATSTTSSTTTPAEASTTTTTTTPAATSTITSSATSTTTPTATSTTESTTISTTTPVNDKTNYKGDKISFPVRRKATYKDENDKDHELCIPAKTGMRGLGKMNGTKDLPVRILDKTLGHPTACDGKSELPTDLVVLVHNKDEVGFSRYGWTYGTLIVPYKYSNGGSKNFKANTSLGGYFGRRFDPNELGIQLNVVAFIGAAAADAKTVNDAGEEKSETLMGVSYGGGLIFTLKDEFQSGIIFGKDRYGASGDKKIEDAGKTWVAIAIGFEFGQ